MWEITEPLIPVAPKRAQGGGIPRADKRQTFAAIAFVLTAGCAWHHLPPPFGASHHPSSSRQPSPATRNAPTETRAKASAPNAIEIEEVPCPSPPPSNPTNGRRSMTTSPRSTSGRSTGSYSTTRKSN
ncbi:transposase [Glycomyces tritici]|uniref:transposase n=1 Tax=Glycomyces tritici TaxID=2665176 RepID=UPI003EB87AB2